MLIVASLKKRFHKKLFNYTFRIYNIIIHDINCKRKDFFSLKNAENQELFI